jgi:hypothetical protein
MLVSKLLYVRDTFITSTGCTGGTIRVSDPSCLRLESAYCVLKCFGVLTTDRPGRVAPNQASVHGRVHEDADPPRPEEPEQGGAGVYTGVWCLIWSNVKDASLQSRVPHHCTCTGGLGGGAPEAPYRHPQ